MMFCPAVSLTEHGVWNKFKTFADRGFHVFYIATLNFTIIRRLRPLSCRLVSRYSYAENVALLYGFASGWGVSVAVHGFSIGYYKFKESWGLEHDKKQD